MIKAKRYYAKWKHYTPMWLEYLHLDLHTINFFKGKKTYTSRIIAPFALGISLLLALKITILFISSTALIKKAS